MIQFICFFTPAFITLMLIYNYNKKTISNFNYIIYYFNIVLIINLLNSFILNIVFKNGQYLLNENSFTNSFVLKYLLLSIFFAFIISIFYYLIKITDIHIDFKMLKLQKKRITKRRIVASIFMFISIILIVLMNWLKTNFGIIPFEQYIFHLLVPLEGTSVGYFTKCLSENIFLIFVASIIIFPLFTNILNYQPKLNLLYKNNKYNIKVFPFKFLKKNYFIISTILIISSLLLLFHYFGAFIFIKNHFETTTLFEEYYVDSNSVNLSFPQEKKNLILIYLESMETSFSSKENGGLMENSYTVNLDNIAKHNIKFSNSNQGGIQEAFTTSWTVSGLVSTTTGIPLKTAVNIHEYGSYDEYLPNALALGDILKQEGYNQTFMIGSDINFGGRKKYYNDHGSFDIFDYNTAIEDSIIDSDYFVWWGFEDRILFKSAKEKLTELSQEDEPFNFTMLTVDTHAFDGYQDPECEHKYDKLYSNAIACSDEMVNDFIDWIKKQDFYKDTTIVIIGDHLSMDYHYFEEFTEEELSRRAIYNAFINPFTKASNTTNRTFTAFDIYPSILASMGVEIEGDKLALGVNLFSDEQTIPEQIGLDKFNEELQKRSIFYNDTFIYNRKR